MRINMHQQQELTPSATARLLNIQYAIWSASVIGGIGGVVYSNKTGGGGWRGFGYFLLGSFVVGAVAGIATMPLSNKIIKDGTISMLPTKPINNVQNVQNAYNTQNAYTY